jgi:putative transposase
MKEIEFIPTNYDSDLTDAEWKIIEKHFPLWNSSDYHKRSLVNAVFYIDKTGCQWRYLPKDYPPHGTVWSFYRRARISGLWELIMDELVVATRKKAGRKASPSYTLIDSQSAKTVSASEERGIDGGKKSKRTETSYSN